MEADTKQLITDLKSAPYFCRRLIRLNLQMEALEWELTGMARHGVRLTKEQERSALPMPAYQRGGSDSYRYDIYSKMEACRKEMKRCRGRLNDCRAIERLEQDDRELIYDLYFNGMSQSEAGRKYRLLNPSRHVKTILNGVA